MPLLPYDTLLIDSPLPVEQARARLERATGPRKWLSFGPPPHPFHGEVTGHEVRIQRAIGYRNSFLPHIEARLEPRAEGCRLAGTMSLHPLTGVFMILWVAVVALVGVPAALMDVARGELGPGTWMPMGMLIFGWVLCSGAFTMEASIARTRLGTLLEGAVAER